MKISSHQHRNLGLSLIEMMVAMVLGLFLVAGVGHLFLNANKSLLARNELATMQEDARFALDTLAKDIRVAGQTGCPSDAKLANTVYSTRDDRQWMLHFDKGISGIPLSNKRYVDTSSISESIVIHQLDLGQGELITAHNLANNQLTVPVSNDGRFRRGKVLAVVSSDCSQVSIFRSGANSTGNTVSNESTVSGNLYNRTSHLGGSFNAVDTGGVNGASDLNTQGSQLYPVNSVAYYIRNSTYKLEDHEGDNRDVEITVPILYRRPIGEASNGNRMSTEQLVEGVEQIAIHYGVDSDSDGVVNRYQSAATMTLDSSDWKKVISVRLELLMRSLDEVADSAQSFFFNGTRVTPTDLYLRQNVVMTVELRNRSR